MIAKKSPFQNSSAFKSEHLFQTKDKLCAKNYEK